MDADPNTERFGRLIEGMIARVAHGDPVDVAPDLDAREAEHWGLVSKVVLDAELESSALAYCQTLARRNRSGITAMKRLAREGLDLPLQAALDFEQREVVPSLMTDNVTEGLAAFLERREPKFR